MKRNSYFGLLLGIFLALLIVNCAARNSLSPKKLSSSEQGQYKLLKKAGATKEELEKYLLYHLTSAPESIRDSIWREFWDRRYQALTAEEQAFFYTFLSDSLSRIKYLSLKDEKARRGVIKKLQDKERAELIKTAEGKILYFSLKLLFSQAKMEEFLMLPDSLREEWLRIWWKKKDPDLTSEVNELKKKFDQRVQYALTYYHTPGQKPWDDRGDVYILYGEPDGIEQADYYFNSRGLDSFEYLGETSTIDQVKEDQKSRAQVWVYFKHGTFQFQDSHVTGYWELVPYKMFTSSTEGSTMALTQFLSTRTEKVDMGRTDISIDLVPLKFAGDWWEFWNEGDTYDLRVNLGIPLGKLGILPVTDSLGREMSQFIFRVDVAILDRDSMNTIARDSSIIINQLPKNLNRDDLLWVDQFSWDSLPPEDYIVSVSVKDSVSQKIGIYTDTAILVSHVYATAQEKISYLIMTDQILAADSAYKSNGGKFIRKSLVIRPRPGNVFVRGQLAGFYCELYELIKGNDDSLNTLAIYNILYQTEKDSFAFFAPPESVYINLPSDSQPFLMGTLTTLKFPPGYYVLHIVVYDLNDNDPKSRPSKPREAVVGFRIS